MIIISWWRNDKSSSRLSCELRLWHSILAFTERNYNVECYLFSRRIYTIYSRRVWVCVHFVYALVRLRVMLLLPILIHIIYYNGSVVVYTQRVLWTLRTLSMIYSFIINDLCCVLDLCKVYQCTYMQEKCPWVLRDIQIIQQRTVQYRLDMVKCCCYSISDIRVQIARHWDAIAGNVMNLIRKMSWV